MLLCITNNSIKHQSFVYTWLNNQILRFITIQFSISHLFALSFNVKQCNLTHRLDPISCYLSKPGWTREWWHWRCILHSLKLQNYWGLPIRFFNVVSRILVRSRDLRPLKSCIRCILQPQLTGLKSTIPLFPICVLNSTTAVFLQDWL